MAPINLLSSPDQKPSQPIIQSINPKVLPAGTVRQRHVQAGYTMVKFGLASDRPVTTNEIVLYFSTDSHILSFWTGSGWLQSAAFT